MAKQPKPSLARINALTDTLTAEHPEHSDVLVVKAAITRVLEEQALLGDEEVIRQAVEILTAVPQDEGTPEDRTATAAAVAAATAPEDEEAEAEDDVEQDEEPAEDTAGDPYAEEQPPAPPVAPTSMPERPGRLPAFAPTTSVPQTPGMRLEPVPYGMACQMTLADVIEKGYDGVIVHGDMAYVISLSENQGGIPAASVLSQTPAAAAAKKKKARWDYRVDDRKRLPPHFKHQNGEPNHEALVEAMFSEKPPHIPGVVISENL